MKCCKRCGETRSCLGISLSKMIRMRNTVNPDFSARDTAMLVKSWECRLRAKIWRVTIVRKRAKAILDTMATINGGAEGNVMLSNVVPTQ